MGTQQKARMEWAERVALTYIHCYVQNRYLVGSWRRQWHRAPVLLPGRIPWMEEPGRLQSMGLLRVRHDWVTSLSLSCLGEGNGNPLQCSCQENPRDGGASWAAIYGVAQSWTWLKWLSSSSSIFLISKIWSYQKKVKTKLDSIQAVYNLICITWRPNLEKYIQFYPEKWNILILEW